MSYAVTRVLPGTLPGEAVVVRTGLDDDADAHLAAPDVLVVDGDDNSRERLRLFLEDAGYQVSTASNGTEALACLRQRFTPLLITDVAMTGMGGLELCRELRQCTWPSYLYVIVWSLCARPEEVVEGLTAGADEYVSKHATKSEILARLMVGRRHAGLDQALRREVMASQALADTDELTGTASHRCLVRGLEQALARSSQQRQWLSVLMCDLDHFASINERWGHAVGDEVLRAFVARVCDLISATDGWIGRYSGEEFVIVLPNTRPSLARLIARRVRDTIAAHAMICSAGALPLSVSISVTGVGPNELRRGVAVPALLAFADRCLHAGKARGRDAVTTHAFRAAVCVIRP
jgi:diguanylate cyclase (GGDEF)-like protein